MSCEGKLVIQPLYRPGAIEVSFGGYIDEDETYNCPTLDEEICEWSDVFKGEWRVVS